MGRHPWTEISIRVPGSRRSKRSHTVYVYSQVRTNPNDPRVRVTLLRRVQVELFSELELELSPCKTVKSVEYASTCGKEMGPIIMRWGGYCHPSKMSKRLY